MGVLWWQLLVGLETKKIVIYLYTCYLNYGYGRITSC